MLSIEHCRKKLEKYGKKYSDEEVEQIREKLYFFADIQINHSNNGKHEECNNLHKSVNGRAS